MLQVLYKIETWPKEKAVSVVLIITTDAIYILPHLVYAQQASAKQSVIKIMDRFLTDVSKR